MLTLTRSANGAKLSKLSEHTVAALLLYIIIFLVLFISLVNQRLVHVSLWQTAVKLWVSTLS